MASNIFLSLNVPTSGSGTVADVSNMAARKTFTCSGVFNNTLIVDASEDGVTFAPILQIDPPNGEPLRFELTVVASHLRARRVGSDSTPGTVLTVAAEADLNNVFGVFNVPPSAGAGVLLDTSAYGEVKSICVSGQAYNGKLIVEGSADDVTWDVVAQFDPGVSGTQLNVQTVNGTWKSMRVRRLGGLAPMGQPTVTIGAGSLCNATNDLVTEDRFYAVDYDHGNDNNKGWAVTTVDAVNHPKKTWAGLLDVLPKNGNGFDATIYVARRDLDSTPGVGPMTYPETLDFPGVYGYINLFVQGAPNNLPAAGYTGTAVELIDAGAYPYTGGLGTSGLDLRVVSDTNEYTFVVQTNVGTPAWVTDQVMGYRLRLMTNLASPGTFVSGSAMIYSNTTNQVTLARKVTEPDGTSNNFWLPAAGDLVRIERPGVIFTGVYLNMSPAENVYVNGIGAVNSWQVLDNTGVVHHAFCAGWGNPAPGNGCNVNFSGIEALGLNEWTRVNSDLVPNDVYDLGVGFFRRGLGASDTRGTDFNFIRILSASEVILVQGDVHTELHLTDVNVGKGPSQPIGQGANVGLFAGSRLIGGTYIRQSFRGNEAPELITPGASYTTIGADEAGIGYVTNYYQNTRFERNYSSGMANFGGIRVRDSSPWFDGAEIHSITDNNAPGMTIEGTGLNIGLKRFYVYDITAHPSIDVQNCVGCDFVYDFASITLVQNSGYGGLALPAGTAAAPIYLNLNRIANMKQFVDLVGNTFTTISVVTAATPVFNGIMRASFVGKNLVRGPAAGWLVVYLSGGGATGLPPEFLLAQADDPTSVDTTIGVLVNDTAQDAFGLIVTAGPAIVTAVLTDYSTGDIAYVSAVTAGMIVDTAPAAGNEVFRIGRLLSDELVASGVDYAVNLNLDLVSVPGV